MLRKTALLLVVAGALAATMGAVASADDGAATQVVSMTFAEPVHPALGCPGFPDVSCGRGEVVPLGQATEVLQFGAGCGGSCDLRTIYLDQGSLVLEETVNDVRCPHVCRPGPLEIGSGALTDVVVAGTGSFEGASGTLTGNVKAAVSNARPAGKSIVRLSGTINFSVSVRGESA